MLRDFGVRHHERVRGLGRRDVVTVDIATGLALFAGVVLLGGGLVLLLNVAFGFAGPLKSALFYGVVGCAATLMIGYLYRHRRRDRRS